jgi:hypothetical protein
MCQAVYVLLDVKRWLKGYTAVGCTGQHVPYRLALKATFITACGGTQGGSARNVELLGED